MLDLRAEQVAAPFDEQRVRRLDVLVGRGRGEEVARVREAIRTDRSAVRQREAAAVVLAHIGARRTVDQLDAEDHAARNDAYFARRDLDHTEFSAEAQAPLL